MSAFGNLWDSNHTVLITNPDGSGKLNVDLVIALRDHLIREHRDEISAMTRRCIRENQATLWRLRREEQRDREWLKVKLRQHAMWNNGFLKQINNEGTLL